MRCLKHQLPAIVPRVQGWGIIQMKTDVSFFGTGPLCSSGTCQIPAFHKGMLKGQAEIGDYDKRDDAPC
jgi:hypothetical protein